ncbi:MAG: signal peptide peptidase SppA [Pseudomonadota bacterium]
MRKHPVRKFIIFLCCMLLCIFICSWLLGRLGLLQDIMPPARDRIAVIEVAGLITQSRPFIEKLNQYSENDRVKAIVVRIDSPGGSVGPAQEIYEELMKVRDKKPLVASMGSVAASGGYYIACAAHKIIANPGTLTGSIGVIIESANVEELLGKIGLKSVVIKSGKYKDILSPTRQLKEEETGLIQGVIDNIHSQFIDAVAAGRGMPREKIAEIADGRILSGEQAKRLGLVDELGNLPDALKLAAEKAGIQGKPDVVYPEKKRPALWEFILDSSLSRLEELMVKNYFKANLVLAPTR